MADPHISRGYSHGQHLYSNWNAHHDHHMDQIEGFDETQDFDPNSNDHDQIYGYDPLEEGDMPQAEDHTQFGPSYTHTPLSRQFNITHTPIKPSLPHYKHAYMDRSSIGTYISPSDAQHPSFSASPHLSQQPSISERGSNPRNSHGIPLKPVSILPDMYRSFFKFGVFNAVQSECYDKIMKTTDNMVISAPTGSGKTVLFELSLIRLLMKNNSHDVKCVYMAPTKALCSERFRDWTAKFDPLGVKCCELTGDTVGYGRNALGEAKSSSVIITTPEKFDSLSRNWYLLCPPKTTLYSRKRIRRDHGDILSRTQLFLIDEVHILNETRGSTLEVVASRMKTRGISVRFVLVSATVPNIDDLAAWIGNGLSPTPATVFNFGDEFRPCKLTRVVYGYPSRNQNDFSFSRTLDYKLLPLLQQHANNKPVLIFCATRKGVVGTAEVLMKEYQKLAEGKQSLPWMHPRNFEATFHDNQLQELAKSGIGVHHAGLTLDDRRVTEDLFLKKIIRVVVATSTLAVGVNLREYLIVEPFTNLALFPAAHTVVVKGVKMWQNGGWQEYSDLDFIQMIGRAGRPQFDKEGVAIIMCDTAQERKYKALVSGRTLLESCLHVNLSEHLNSEIGLGTISDLTTAKEWLHNSFFFQRIQKNPDHYALDKASDQTWQSRIEELVESSITDLRKHELVTDDGVKGDFISTEYGEIMSKYYIRLSTVLMAIWLQEYAQPLITSQMKSILKLPDKSTLRDILELISGAEECVKLDFMSKFLNLSRIGDLRLRAGEKQIYKKMGEHNDIRYRTKVDKASDKVFIIMQAVLGGIPLNSSEYKTADSQPFLEALTVFKHAARIARTIVEVAIVKQSGAILKYGMELVRSLTAKAWEDRPMVLRQIEQIGEKSIKVDHCVILDYTTNVIGQVLAQSGIATLAALRRTSPGRLEQLLNRRPPFGDVVLAAARELPQYSVKISEVSVNTFGGNKPITIELNVECSLIEISEMPPIKDKRHKQRSLGMTGVLTLTSDKDFVDFRRIPTKALRESKSFLVKVKLTKPSQTVSTYISPDNYAGLTVIETYRPTVSPEEYPTLDTRPVTYDVDAVLEGLEEDPTFWDILEDDASTGESPKAPKNSKPLPPSASIVRKGTSKISKLPDKPSRNRISNAPAKLPNGNYPCNHTCKRKNQCRHLCCRDGLPNPPKQSTHIVLPEARSDPKQHSMSDSGLKHLEILHRNTGGMELSGGRHLKLDSAHPSSTKKKGTDKPELTRILDLPNRIDTDNNGEDLPDPQEILRLPIRKQRRSKSPESSGSDTFSEVFVLEHVIKSSSMKGKSSDSLRKQPLNSLHKSTASSRRTRPLSRSVSPSPPAKKRKEDHLFSRNPDVIKALTTVSPLEEQITSALATSSRSARLPLFLEGASSSAQSFEAAEAQIHEEPFMLDLDAFDMEPSTMSTHERIEQEIPPDSSRNDLKQCLSTKLNEDIIMATKDIPESVIERKDIDVASDADYEQGIAELKAWLYSGAVEFTD
ncbi:P-loop containing nucleoside triphosphate hydrolase protein [Ramaria rubella]|nr:P-loop containing nucleoside triphosphate hydrolase protein [Ramaria rubella]